MAGEVANGNGRTYRGGTSDHVALITRLREEVGSWKLFRAYNSWFDKYEVKELVKEAWRVEVVGNPLYKLIMKMKI